MEKMERYQKKLEIISKIREALKNISDENLDVAISAAMSAAMSAISAKK